MSKITISAEYLGDVIKAARTKNISASRLAHLLGCNGKQLHRYETGHDLIPYEICLRVFIYAAKMDEMLDKEK